MKVTTPKNSPLTLYQARANSALRIVSISGGWGVRQNLNAVGLHVGDEIRIVRRAPFRGPLVVASHGTAVAIGRQLAEKVRVEAVR